MAVAYDFVWIYPVYLAKPLFLDTYIVQNFLYKIEQYTQQNEYLYQQKDMYKNIHSSIVKNTTLEAIQMAPQQ